MGALGEISVCTRTNCACTDISPLACTPENTAETSAALEIRLIVWKSSSVGGLRTGALASARPADQALPKAAPAVLEQPGFRETQIALRTEDEVVVHGNVQQ